MATKIPLRPFPRNLPEPTAPHRFGKTIKESQMLVMPALVH